MKKIFEHIKTFSMNLKEKFQGIIMFVSKIIFISCIVIILIRQFKNQIKSLLVFMGFNEIYLNKIIMFVKCISRSILQIALIYSCLSFIYLIIKKIYIKCCRNKEKREYDKMMLSNSIDRNIKELYKNMYNYFSDKENNLPIFISGAWGAGKTYIVNKFINLYYRYSKQKIYKISCFGITTKELLMDRIKQSCENEENSFFSYIIYLIGEISIIGLFLKKILEKRYDINNIKKNSIFIFDNFERIEWVRYGRQLGTTKTNYENAIGKYDIVVGIIDELIEKYKMKVIIIGNESEMVPNYVYDTFISKLGCKKYTIIPKEKIFKDIWNEIIEKEIISEQYKKEFANILEEIKQPSEIIWRLSGNNNIRILYKILYNYINFMVFLFEIDYIFNDEINEKISIYYTNLFINLDRYVEEIKEYESIGLFFAKRSKNRREAQYGCLSDIDAMWCSNTKLSKIWRNLEESHYELNELHQKFISEYKRKYISIKNCTNSDLDIEILDIDDMLCLLTYNENFRNNAIMLLNNDKIDFSSIFILVSTLEKYDLEKILKRDKELINLFFDKLREKYGIGFKQEIEKNSKESEKFKKIYQIYEEINSSN
ncbi:MAG: hypothetical protein IJN50_04290 [Clostridia bacterium]|nr:hypothetical protein [Clostridia bacterium]